MKECPKCNIQHEKPGKFCSRNCANSRGPLPLIKRIFIKCPVCDTLTGNPKFCSVKCSNKIRINKRIFIRKINPTKQCPTCYANHTKSGKYCSRDCSYKRISTDEQRAQRSIKSKETNAKYWTPENRQKHSRLMKRIVADDPESYSTNNVSGRVKNIEYNGYKVKGSWELIVAQVLDKYNITWTNNVSGYEYYWNGTKHLYFPDFYLPEYNVFIEVKGYQRDRDLCKWKDFPYDLMILKENEINELKSFIN